MYALEVQVEKSDADLRARPVGQSQTAPACYCNHVVYSTVAPVYSTARPHSANKMDHKGACMTIFRV